MISQVNVSPNSQLMIDNTHKFFHVLVSIITERFENTENDQSNYYLREESKKESQNECQIRNNTKI